MYDRWRSTAEEWNDGRGRLFVYKSVLSISLRRNRPCNSNHQRNHVHSLHVGGQFDHLHVCSIQESTHNSKTTASLPLTRRYHCGSISFPWSLYKLQAFHLHCWKWWWPYCDRIKFYVFRCSLYSTRSSLSLWYCGLFPAFNASSCLSVGIDSVQYKEASFEISTHHLHRKLGHTNYCCVRCGSRVVLWIWTNLNSRYIYSHLTWWKHYNAIITYITQELMY